MPTWTRFSFLNNLRTNNTKGLALYARKVGVAHFSTTLHSKYLYKIDFNTETNVMQGLREYSNELLIYSYRSQMESAWFRVDFHILFSLCGHGYGSSYSFPSIAEITARLHAFPALR